MKLINIGFGNMVSAARLIAIVSPDSAPVKRTVQEARDRGMVVDGTYGRRTRQSGMPLQLILTLLPLSGASSTRLWPETIPPSLRIC